MKKADRLRGLTGGEESGLVFNWRRANGGFLRTVAGVVAAVGVFVATMSVFQVRGKTVHIPSRESARVMVLLSGDVASRELQAWAKRNSPFPDRWDPESDQTLQAEMKKVTAELVEQSRYTPLLRPMPPRVVKRPLPELFEVDSPRLPALNRIADPMKSTLPPERVRVVARAEGPLKERWAGPAVEWDREDAAKLIGSEAAFFVGVSPAGEVSFCVLLEGLDERFGVELDGELSRWLRRYEAQPAESGTEPTWDVVRLTITAADEDPREEAP